MFKYGQDIVDRNDCLAIKDLKVNGYDIMSFGFIGRDVGLVLRWLLERVMEEYVKNDRESLLAEVEKYG